MTTQIGSHHHNLGALLILLLASICASGQLQDLPRTRATPASAKVESKTGDISGKVVNESGQPLGNGNIYVRPARPEGLPDTNTTTNREGVFKVSGLQPGSYTVLASKPAYFPKSLAAGPAAPSTDDSVTLVLIKGGNYRNCHELERRSRRSRWHSC
jgi:hypothetical protein